MATIVVADDHVVVRMAVRLMLEQAGHDVVGEANSGAEVVALVRRMSPQLVILDIDMPQLDGFEVLKRLCRSVDTYKVIIFSGMAADQYAVRCARAGASGFINKEAELAELLSAINIVLAGYTLFPSTQPLQDYAQGPASEAQVIRLLSERELSVLRFLSQGCRVGVIAEKLMLSQKTVSTYKLRIQKKLGVTNLAELIELAKRNDVA